MKFGAAAAERRQQLKAQAALQALREREIAAQAELLGQRAQLIMEQKAEKEQDAADLLASQELYHYHTEVGGKTPEEAQAMVDQALAYKNPRALEMVNKARALGMKGQTTEHQRALEAMQSERLGLEAQREERMGRQDERLAAKEKRLGARFNLSDTDRQKVASWQKEIDLLNKERLGLDPEVEGNKTKRLKLSFQAGQLQKRIDALGAAARGEDSKGKSAMDGLEIGKIYRDGSGAKAKYLGGPKGDASSWEEVE